MKLEKKKENAWPAGLILLLTALLMVSAVSACRLYPGAVYQLPDGLDLETWEGDIYFFEHELPKLHVNIHHTLTKQEYLQEIQRLKVVCEVLEPEARSAEFRRFIAMIGDAHTSYTVPMAAAYPLNLAVFDDGVFVTASLREDGRQRLVHADPSGNEPARVELIAIDNHPLFDRHAALLPGGGEEGTVHDLLKPLISHENDGSFLRLLSSALLDPVLLYGAGVTAEKARCSMTFRYPDTATETLEFAAVSLTGFRDLDWAVWYDDAYPNSDRSSLPDYLRYAGEYYWGKRIGDTGTLYILYNRCANDPERKFASWLSDLLEAEAGMPIDTVIIDLRNNGGGDSRIINPLYQRLNGVLSGTERFALIGPGSFSSALMNAVDLKRNHGAVLAGEPTGGRPNHYGEVRTTELPTGGLVSWSTRYFTMIPGSTDDALYPDRPISLGSDDFFARNDPVLEAVLNGR